MSTTPRIRLTGSTRLVLDALFSVVDDPPWGYRICEVTELSSGTVYPILDRLEQAGWIVGAWEKAQPADRPRRRLYTVTNVGRAQYANALTARASRGRRSLRFILGGDAT